jgi:hypothetical protein
MQSRFINTAPLERIAFASSLSPRASVAALQDRWTELAVYYRPGERRPFLTESFGKTRVPGEVEFRRQRVGKTWDEVSRLFDNSRLADEVTRQVQDWLDKLPRKAATAMDPPRIQFDGAGGLRGALSWLYPDIKTETALAAAYEVDWGVPMRTVRNALREERETGKLTPWVKAFIGALMHFDREAFHAARRA